MVETRSSKGKERETANETTDLNMAPGMNQNQAPVLDSQPESSSAAAARSNSEQHDGVGSHHDNGGQQDATQSQPVTPTSRPHQARVEDSDGIDDKLMAENLLAQREHECLQEEVRRDAELAALREELRLYKEATTARGLQHNVGAHQEPAAPMVNGNSQPPAPPPSQ
ncbi:hypothetical protein KEM56_002506, partial [Ascosphaera pollenicola]